MSKEQVRPGERKAKEAEDIKLLGKKLEASEPLNTCYATDKFSRHLWVCVPKISPLSWELLFCVAYTLQQWLYGCHVYKL